MRAPSGIRAQDPSVWTAKDNTCPRLRGQCDWHLYIIIFIILVTFRTKKRFYVFAAQMDWPVLIDAFPCLLLYLVNCTQESDVWGLPDPTRAVLCADLANWAVMLRACLFGLPERERTSLPRPLWGICTGAHCSHRLLPLSQSFVSLFYRKRIYCCGENTAVTNLARIE
jgi:hypothetical protein